MTITRQVAREFQKALSAIEMIEASSMSMDDEGIKQGQIEFEAIDQKPFSAAQKVVIQETLLGAIDRLIAFRDGITALTEADRHAPRA